MRARKAVCAKRWRITAASKPPASLCQAMLRYQAASSPSGGDCVLSPRVHGDGRQSDSEMLVGVGQGASEWAGNVAHGVLEGDGLRKRPVHAAPSGAVEVTSHIKKKEAAIRKVTTMLEEARIIAVKRGEVARLARKALLRRRRHICRGGKWERVKRPADRGRKPFCREGKAPRGRKPFSSHPRNFR